ncbi:MFS transporter [Alkalibaculum sporogenes]|nr:MFS transporter [Alkalibaculum sporogenes]
MKNNSNSKFFYGYTITLLSALCYFASSGILTVSAGNVINELINTFGWSGTEVSLAFSVRSLFGLALPFVGYITVKYGPRYVIGFSGIVTTICLVLTASIEKPWQFILLYGIGVSFSMLFNDYLGIFAIVNNWWEKKRGTHTGIVNAAGAFGGVVFPIIIALILKNYGWKVALYSMAAMLFFISVLPQLLWYRNFPSQLNLQVDNGFEEKEENSKRIMLSSKYFSPVNWETKDALKTPQIWIVIFMWSGLVFTYIAVMYFSITHLVMNGMDAVTASTILGAINFIAMIVSLLAGRLIDKLGPKTTLVAVCIFSTIGSLLILIVKNVVTGWIFAAVYGLSVGALVPCVATIIPSYYGTKNYPHIQGSVQWILAISSGLAATGIGIIIDKTGSLIPAFFVAAGVSAIAVILALTLKPPVLLEKHLLELNKETQESHI